jgi:hypothetical protein
MQGQAKSYRDSGCGQVGIKGKLKVKVKSEKTQLKMQRKMKKTTKKCTDLIVFGQKDAKKAI